MELRAQLQRVEAVGAEVGEQNSGQLKTFLMCVLQGHSSADSSGVNENIALSTEDTRDPHKESGVGRAP